MSRSRARSISSDHRDDDMSGSFPTYGVGLGKKIDGLLENVQLKYTDDDLVNSDPLATESRPIRDVIAHHFLMEKSIRRLGNLWNQVKLNYGNPKSNSIQLEEGDSNVLLRFGRLLVSHRSPIFFNSLRQIVFSPFLLREMTIKSESELVGELARGRRYTHPTRYFADDSVGRDSQTSSKISGSDILTELSRHRYLFEIVHDRYCKHVAKWDFLPWAQCLGESTQCPHLCLSSYPGIAIRMQSTQRFHCRMYEDSMIFLEIGIDRVDLYMNVFVIEKPYACIVFISIHQFLFIQCVSHKLLWSYTF
jgi:hypothetical protein